MTTLACCPRILTALAIAVSLWLLVLSDGASAEDKKVSGTAKFGPTLSQTMLLPGDASKHEVMLVNRIQFWNSANPDWNNVEVTQFSYTDYTAGTGYPRWTLQTRPNVDGAKPAIGSGRSSECVVARSLQREQVAFSGDTTIAPPAEIVRL